jgi:mono/diheme cytochrome c family protein
LTSAIEEVKQRHPGSAHSGTLPRDTLGKWLLLAHAGRFAPRIPTGLEEALPVIARKSRQMLVAPMLGLVGLGIGLTVLSGCESQSYSEEMTYPVRSDVIVADKPSADPKHFERPGQWAFLMPEFDDPQAKGKKYDPGKLTAGQRAAFEKMLNERFGTPARPTVKGIDDEARAKVFLAKDEAELNKHLADGSSLYRRHCLHCHGLTGDGHGPTAPWVNPHPRDYRPGMFKFTSTMGGRERKPSRDDLIRTLKQGVESTSMPSFGLLPEKELNDIISYVIHLSIRGNVEYRLMSFLFADSENPQGTGEAAVAAAADEITEIGNQWAKAQSDPIPVTGFPKDATDLKSAAGQESIRRGHQVFIEKEGKCIECHADYGRQLAYKYDDWGTIVRPRDVTTGVLRGGRRPVDIYFRLFGINGTPMPKFAQENDPEKMRQVWDLVNFIRAAPYPGMLPDDVRRQVYRTDKGG